MRCVQSLFTCIANVALRFTYFLQRISNWRRIFEHLAAHGYDVTYLQPETLAIGDRVAMLQFLWKFFMTMIVGAVRFADETGLVCSLNVKGTLITYMA